MIRLRSLVVCIAAILALSGCGGQQFDTGTVSGTVTLDGQPLANASVQFTPTGVQNFDTPAPGSYGRTNANGEYSLKVITTDAEGALVGMHRVSITLDEEESEDPEKMDLIDDSGNRIPAKYNSQSQLTYEVKAGENKDVNFDLQSK